MKDSNEVPMDVCDESIAAAESTATEVKSTSSGSTNTSSGTIAGTANATSPLSHSMLHGCDNSNSNIVGGNNTVSLQTSAAVIDSHMNLNQAPSPRHISEQEMHILQVKYTQFYATNYFLPGLILFQTSIFHCEVMLYLFFNLLELSESMEG